MSAAATSTTGDHKLLTYRVERIEEAHREAVAEIRDAVKSIDKSLQMLSLVEAQHAATREVVKQQSGRLRAIELELPTLRLVRTWVITGVVGVVAAVGVAVVRLVVR